MFLSYKDYIVDIKISGYEFENSKDSYDRNWLIVEVIYKNNIETIIKRDPALLTWEIDEIINWLKKVSSQIRVNDLTFLEPEIMFINREDYNYIEFCYGLSINNDCIKVKIENIEGLLGFFMNVKKKYPKR